MHKYVHMNTEIVQTKLTKENSPLFLSLFLVWLLAARVWECVDGEPLHTRLTAGVYEHHPQSTIFGTTYVCACMRTYFLRGDWMTFMLSLSVQCLFIGTTCAENIHSFRLFRIKFEACAMWGISNRVVRFLLCSSCRQCRKFECVILNK